MLLAGAGEVAPLSLVVSLRIPDGVVIAADSLSTVQGTLMVQPQAEVVCPKCAERIQMKDLPPLQMPMPLSTSSFAQKLFPFRRRFGVAAYGVSILLEKTVGYHIQTLEAKAKQSAADGVTDTAKLVLDRFDDLIHQQFKDIDGAPDGFYPLGFQVAGYDGQQGKTIEVHIGKKSHTVEQAALGCTVGGDSTVVAKLWELGSGDPRQQPKFASFSLQDAIDYADFLINTTAKYQRFAMMIPSVGGDVDIALVTLYHGFRWIRQKELARILVDKEEERNA